MEGFFNIFSSVAIFLTILILLIGLFKINKFKSEKEISNKLNVGDIGSFIGGILSPITLLWIIYSQIIQFDYIKQNSEYITQQIKENNQKSEPIFHIYAIHRNDLEIKNLDDYYYGLFLPNHYGDLRKEVSEENIFLNILKKDYEEIKNKIKKYSEIELFITNSGGDSYNLLTINPELKHIGIYKREDRNLLNKETKKIRINIPLSYYFSNYKETIYFLIKIKDIYGKNKTYRVDISVNKNTVELFTSVESAFKDVFEITKKYVKPKEYNEYLAKLDKKMKKLSENIRAESLDFNVTLINEQN